MYIFTKGIIDPESALYSQRYPVYTKKMKMYTDLHIKEKKETEKKIELESRGTEEKIYKVFVK